MFKVPGFGGSSRLPPAKSLPAPRSRPPSRPQPAAQLRTQPLLSKIQEKRDETRVTRIPARGYSGRIFEHAFEIAGRGTTAFSNGACRDLFDGLAREQALDRSTLYNKYFREKVGGKVFPNRIEFRDFLVTKVFSEFASHLSPKWQKLFKEQLKDLEFKDAYELYIQFSEISKAYFELDEEKNRIDTDLKEMEKARQGKSEKLSEKEDQLIFRSLDIEEEIEKLDQRLGALEIDCFIRTSMSHHKKLDALKNKRPEKLQKAEKKLQEASGLTKEQMKCLTNLQHEYAKKMGELSQLDRNLHPSEFAKKEEECKNCMKALMGIARLNPKDLGKLALKFEQNYRYEAGKKLDPEDFVSTECKHLTGASAICVVYLLITLLWWVHGWAIGDDLKNEIQKEEDTRKLFAHDVIKIHDKIAINLESMKHELKYYPDIEDKLDMPIKELEKLNFDLLTAVSEYKKNSSEQLNQKNIVSDLAKEKIKDYKSLEKYFHKSNEPIQKKSEEIIRLQNEIKEKYYVLQIKYQEYKFEIDANTLLDGCKRDFDVIARNEKHLSKKDHEVLAHYQREYSGYKSRDLGNADKNLIKDLESFKTGLDSLRRKVMAKTQSLGD